MRNRICKEISLYTVCLAFLVTLGFAAATNTRQIASGEKAKVKGSITARSGDVVTVKDPKAGDLVAVLVDDNTKVERKKGVMKFRKTEMDVTAMLPGLTIEAEGVGNDKGQLAATKIGFSPDEFQIAIAQEQQIMANKSAAKSAQTTANQGVAAAGDAQSSANQAQTTADVAGTIAVTNTAAVVQLNHRVSDLDDYKVVAEAGIFFPADGSTLDDAAKADLSKLADIAAGLDGYMIEIAGYASKPGSKEYNMKLSEARGEAVAQYLRVNKNIPMRRMLEPAGYGAARPVADNADPQGRALNRRVDVKVLVNKGINSGM